MIKTIVFDYGGVVFSKNIKKENRFKNLLDNLDRGKLEKVVGDFPKSDGHRLRTGKICSREYWIRFKNKLDLTQEQTNQIKSAWLDLYEIDNGVFMIIKALSKKYHMMVFSGNVRERVMHLNKKYKINGYFDEFIFSYLHGCGKKDAKFYKILRNKIENPDEAVIIDDHINSITNLRKVGFKNTIQFKTSKQLAKDLKKLEIVY